MVLKGEVAAYCMGIQPEPRRPIGDSRGHLSGGGGQGGNNGAGAVAGGEGGQGSGAPPELQEKKRMAYVATRALLPGCGLPEQQQPPSLLYLSSLQLAVCAGSSPVPRSAPSGGGGRGDSGDALPFGSYSLAVYDRGLATNGTSIGRALPVSAQ